MAFVIKGNKQMVFTSLLIFVAWLLQNSPVLEQPLNSVMVKAEPMRIAMEMIGSIKTVTYLGAFKGDTMKPLQLWHAEAAYGALRRQRPLRFQRCVELVKKKGKRFSGVSRLLKASQA